MTTMSPGTRILGLGHYAPERIVPNAEIEAHLGLEEGWIQRRSGIEERRFAAPGQALTDIAAPAAEMALDGSGLERDAIGLVLLATSTPDHLLPPSAPLLAHRLGLASPGAVDLAGACGGFLYALTLADGYVRTQRRAVLVVAANILSRRIDADEPASAILFADAAGAAVLAPGNAAGHGLLAADFYSDGAGYDLIKIEAGGSRTPFDPTTRPEALKMHIADGKRVFTEAVRIMVESSRRVIETAGLEIGQIDRFAPHQANARLFGAVADALRLRPGTTLSSIARFGNSSAATIPLTLSLSHAERPIQNGETLLLAAAGAGLTGGAAIWRW